MQDFPEQPDNDDKIPSSGNEEELPSKTRRKKEMIALQKLGEELTGLNKKQLESLPLPEKLHDAILIFQRLPNSNEARRRQLQFIGRLMRGSDHEEIARALTRLREPDRAGLRRLQQVENWCDRLLEGDEEDITALIGEQPEAERQVVRQLVRQHRKAREKSPSNATEEEAQQRELRVQRRKLFDYLKELFQSAAGSA